MQRADEQPRANQQHQRHRHLRRHQRLAQPRLTAAQHAPRLILQRRRHARPRRLQRRRESEQDARQGRYREGEREDPQIGRRRHRLPRFRIAEISNQHRRAHPRDGEAEHTARRGEQHAFDEQLLDETSAARAERETHRHLALTAGAARQQQVRDIGAGDQQHARGNRHQDPQGTRQRPAQTGSAPRRRLDHDLALDEAIAHRLRRVRERAFLDLEFEPRAIERLQRGLRLFGRHAGLQPGEDADPAVARIVERVVPARRQLRLHHHRHVDLRRDAQLDALEPFARDTDDGVRVRVDDHGLADHRRIGGEAAAPVRVTQHGDRMSVRDAIVIRREHPAGGRGDAERLEVAAGHDFAGGEFGAAGVADVKVVAEAAEDAAEDLIVVADLLQHGVGQLAAVTPVAAVARAAPGDLHDLPRPLDRK